MGRCGGRPSRSPAWALSKEISNEQLLVSLSHGHHHSAVKTKIIKQKPLQPNPAQPNPTQQMNKQDKKTNKINQQKQKQKNPNKHKNCFLKCHQINTKAQVQKLSILSTSIYFLFISSGFHQYTNWLQEGLASEISRGKAPLC